jgi:hypothetical protein
MVNHIMKPPHSLLLFIAALSPAVLLVSSCSKSDSSSSTVQTVKNDAKDAGNGVKAAITDSGDGMKDYSYENRTDFSTDINRMAGKLDNKVHEIEMGPKLADIPDATVKARDSAMNEFNGARANFESRLSSLDNATADTWADMKGNVIQAWKRMQAAYEKVAPFGTGTNPAAVSTPPPSPLAETKTSSPGANYAWVAGHYTPVKGEWTWVTGKWIIPPTVESVWILGNYDAKTKSWSEAHWQPDGIQTVYAP